MCRPNLMESSPCAKVSALYYAILRKTWRMKHGRKSIVPEVLEKGSFCHAQGHLPDSPGAIGLPAGPESTERPRNRVAHRSRGNHTCRGARERRAGMG